jgi:glycosyltransferase involved in cell wall biosynthesis
LVLVRSVSGLIALRLDDETMTLIPITFVTSYGPNAPSTRIRVHEWVRRVGLRVKFSDYLGSGSAGPSVLARHPLATLHAERRLRRLSMARPRLLFIQRQASPLGDGSLERRLLSSAEFSVYDFDDALMWDWGQDRLVRRFAPPAPRACAAVKAADRVIAGNRILAEWAATLNDDIVVIPSCVDVDDYEPKVDFALSDPPLLGWVGSASSVGYLRRVSRALLEIHRRTGARLQVLGPGSGSLGPLDEMTDHVQWSPQAQSALLRTFDVGLMPLPRDSGATGKCGYKLLQYCAAGLPAVATAIGVNQEILAATGLPTPVTEAEWMEAILEVLSLSTESRRTIGSKARGIADSEYSFSRWRSAWEQAVLGPLGKTA